MYENDGDSDVSETTTTHWAAGLNLYQVATDRHCWGLCHECPKINRVQRPIVCNPNLSNSDLKSPVLTGWASCIEYKSFLHHFWWKYWYVMALKLTSVFQWREKIRRCERCLILSKLAASTEPCHTACLSNSVIRRNRRRNSRAKLRESVMDTSYLLKCTREQRPQPHFSQNHSTVFRTQNAIFATASAALPLEVFWNWNGANYKLVYILYSDALNIHSDVFRLMENVAVKWHTFHLYTL